MGSSLSCLWADMINPEVEAGKENIALMVPRPLVFSGVLSHSITLEWQKIAWARQSCHKEYKDQKDSLHWCLIEGLQKAGVRQSPGKGDCPTLKLQEKKPTGRPYWSISNGTPAKYGSKGLQHHTDPNNRGTTSQTSETKNKNRISSSRKDTVLLATLGTNNSRSLGPGGSEGSPAKTGTNPLPDHPSNIRPQYGIWQFGIGTKEITCPWRSCQGSWLYWWN